MAPKRIGGGAGGARDQSYFQAAYSTLTSSENQSVVRSVAVFGVAIAFFASSWSEFLLPPGISAYFPQIDRGLPTQTTRIYLADVNLLSALSD